MTISRPETLFDGFFKRINGDSDGVLGVDIVLKDGHLVPVSYDGWISASRVDRMMDQIQADPGMVVALTGPPGMTWILAAMAIIGRGGVVMEIDHMMTPGEMLFHLNTFEADRLVVIGSMGEAISGMWGGPVIQLATEFLPPPDDGERAMRSIRSRSVLGKSNDVAFLLLTSGTTGMAKGVPLTHKNILSDVFAFDKLNIYQKGDRVLGMLPLHHAYPAMGLFHLPIQLGGVPVFVPDNHPKTISWCLLNMDIALFPGVPAIWEGFHQKLMEGLRQKGAVKEFLAKKILAPTVRSLSKLGFSNSGRLLFPAVHDRFGRSLRALSSGGAPLAPEIIENFMGFGLMLLEGYGLTETSPVISFNVPQAFQIGSVGRPLDGVSVRVSESGELQVKGDNVASSYWVGRQGREPIVDQDGWFSTGDRAQLSDGYITLTGRLKELLVLPNGKKIQPEAIESRWGADPLVSEIAVTLRKGVPWLLVRPDMEQFQASGRTNILPVVTDMFNLMQQSLPSHSRLGGFTIVRDPLPRTRLLKLKRYLLPEIVEEMEAEKSLADGGATPSTVDPVEQKIFSILNEILTIKRPVRMEDHLEIDLGLDSLGRLELVSSLEEGFGARIPEDALLNNILSVKDLVVAVSLWVNGLKVTEKKALEGRYWETPLTEKEEAEVPHRPLSADGRSLSSGLRAFHLFLRGFSGTFFRVSFPRFEKTENGWSYETFTGDKTLWPEGPFVIVANHGSYLDGFLISAALPGEILARTVLLGFSPIFDHPRIHPLKDLFGVVSIDPDKASSALRVSYRMLEGGKGILVFPEGDRSHDGKIKMFRPGTAHLLGAFSCPVIPVGIVGSFEAYPRHRRFPTP
jgi:long-chain acyl-CoA synthetase